MVDIGCKRRLKLQCRTVVMTDAQSHLNADGDQLMHHRLELGAGLHTYAGRDHMTFSFLGGAILSGNPDRCRKTDDGSSAR